MSRSIGDLVASSVGVIAEPDIYEYMLRKSDKFIVIASDGVWEFLSNEQVVEIVSKHYLKGDPTAAVEELVKISREYWQAVKFIYIRTNQ